MPVLDRIPLQRSVAIVTEDSISVRPAGRLVAPLIQALIAGGAAGLIVVILNNDGPLLLLALLLVVVLFLGPVAVLGLVYSAVGSSVLIERKKQSVRMQQGFLGLGIGTADLVPFTRIARVEVAGDHEQELSGGQLNDFVEWRVLVVKDNGREVEIGSVIAVRAFAADGLERANRLARAVAEMAGSEVLTVDLPAPLDAPHEADDAVATSGSRTRRRLASHRPPPPAAPQVDDAAGDGRPDRALELIRDAKTIAVVGVSPRPERDSHDVAKYLIEAGYNVYLVNPDATEVLGRTVYDRLQDLPERVDIVDVFRRAEHVPAVVEDAIAAGAKAVWMQLDIVHEEAAARARAAGLEVVMDRCTKVEHLRLLRGT